MCRQGPRKPRDPCWEQDENRMDRETNQNNWQKCLGLPILISTVKIDIRPSFARHKNRPLYAVTAIRGKRSKTTLAKSDDTTCTIKQRPPGNQVRLRKRRERHSICVIRESAGSDSFGSQIVLADECLKSECTRGVWLEEMPRGGVKEWQGRESNDGVFLVWVCGGRREDRRTIEFRLTNESI